jgi:hypothetical protein
MTGTPLRVPSSGIASPKPTNHVLGFASQCLEERDADHLNLVRAGEARLDALNREQRPDHEPRRHQQHQRHGDLAHDQDALPPKLFTSRRGSARVLDARWYATPDNGDQPEQQARAEGTE